MKQSKKKSLKIVTKNDLRFLFNLLKQRKQYENISHKNFPTYKEHVKFFDSKPYSRWYIIIQNFDKIGSVYLSRLDEIGIHVKDEIKIDEIFRDVIKEVIKRNPRKRYLVNLNPKNHRLVKNLKENNFELIQHTYELTDFKKI